MDDKPLSQRSSNASEAVVEAHSDVSTSLISEIEAIPHPKEEPHPMPADSYDCDVLVIGAGPGGYVAAIRAAQLGGKVVCVEKEHLGGTCLNWGCIPSKAMIASAEAHQHAQHIGDFGISVEGTVSFDFPKIMARKQKIVETLRGGVGALFKKNGVTHKSGTAVFKDANTVSITGPSDSEEVRARAIILATGATAMRLPIPGTENAKNIWTSDDALAATAVPKSMLIVGGGAVGLEFAYVFNSFGCKVTVVEIASRVLPQFDDDLSKEIDRSLKRQGIMILASSQLAKVSQGESGHRCTLTGEKGENVVEAEVVLLGVGRKAAIEGLGLEKIGVELHKRGVKVQNDHMQTNVPSVYAIGDCTGHIQLAHVASMEGIVAASNAMGVERRMDYGSVPNCVYTVPEVASVGLTEAEARSKGYDVKVGKFQFRPLGRSMAANEKEGLVKVVAESRYDELLGVHIVGPQATSLIHEAVAAIKLEATIEYMVDMIHAHPTFSEALIEAYEDVHGKAIHKA